MIIREANESDVAEVRKIINSLQVTREQKGWQNRVTGIFEYTKSEGDLLKALNPYFRVAETNKRIVGFNLSYDSDFFRENFGDTVSFEWRHLLDNYDGRFLYSDQMGVVNPEGFVSGRIAVGIIDDALNFARKRGLSKIFAYVCQEPLANIRSDCLLRRYGFDRVEDVSIEDGIVLGLYRLNLF